MESYERLLKSIIKRSEYLRMIKEKEEIDKQDRLDYAKLISLMWEQVERDLE